MIDPGGDSTAYYDSQGNLLQTSHDDLKNSVVIVDDENLESFKAKLHDIKKTPSRGTAEKLNDEDFNKELRSMGQNYDIDAIKKFYNRNLGDNGSEDGNYLYQRDDMITPGEAKYDIDGGHSAIDWKNNPPKEEGAIGNIHTHEDLLFRSFAPSGADFHSDYEDNPYRDVIVSPKGIYFYNSSKSEFGIVKVPLKNTFNK